MFLTKLKLGAAAAVCACLFTVFAGHLLTSMGVSSPTQAAEPAGAVAQGQEQGQAHPDELNKRVAEVKQQLQQMQQKIAQLEREIAPRRDERNQRDIFPGNRFKYRIPVETGYTENKEGGRIEIQEVWGTRPRIEVGGLYLVRGKYVLPPGERGKLYFYETAEGAWGQGPTATMDLQSTAVDQEPTPTLPVGDLTIAATGNDCGVIVTGKTTSPRLLPNIACT